MNHHWPAGPKSWALPAQPSLDRLWPALLAWCAATAIAILFIDHRLIDLLLSYQVFARFLWRVTHWIPHYLYPLLLVFVVACACGIFAGPSLRQRTASFAAAAFAAGLSVFLTEFVLKPLFGRMDIAHALAAGDFGFHPFETGPEFRAFPSGHAAPGAAAIALLWLCYPRFRVAGAAIVAFISVMLVILRRHFLGDVLAGDLDGFLTAMLVIVIWNRFFSRPVAGDAPPPISETPSALPPP